MSLKDPGQVIKESFSESAQAIKTIAVGGSLVPETFDSMDLTYVAAGNGVGEIHTVTYKSGATTIATLTLTYDASNRISNVTRA